MKTRTKVAGSALALHMLAVSLAFSAGQSSQNYQISADVFAQGAGGATAFSTSYKVSSSIGQYAVVGASVTSASYKLETGFQAAIFETGGGAAPEAYDDWASGIAWGGMDPSPSADPDGDGFQNEQEFIADTNPTQTDSRFHLAQVALNGQTAIVSFHSSADRVYELWFCTDLTDPDGWVKLSGPRVGIGGADSMSYEQQEPTPAGFYRIRVSLP
ncbi:MAG: hypothetical protein JXR23_10550 [Pontiellaceae bacterium]|nr:hypothetical protein [Pontiellaceae bacterium]